MTVEPLQAAVESALLQQSIAAASFFEAPTNSRAYSCTECTRPAYARGLCNAHYLRWQKGMAMGDPVRARKRSDKCATCLATCNGKGGWGLCTKHYKQRRYEAIKDALIKALGGRCSVCGGQFHRAAFDFHHVGVKTKSPAVLLATASPEAISKEFAECVLLCANCHRVEHTKGE